MKYKASDFVFQMNNPIIAKSMDASRRKRIHHYTNLDSLLSILKNRTIKFNRIDNVNDQTEKLFINEQEIINQLFISCFTYRVSEYIPHWYMYSKDVYGIRMSIYKRNESLTTDCLIDYGKPIKAYKNGEKVDELGTLNEIDNFLPTNNQWRIDFKSIDVIYDEVFVKSNPVLYKRSEGGYIIDMSTLGTVKANAWKFEDETRMIAQLRFWNDNAELTEYDYLLVPIKLENIEKIEIVCGPWMTDTLKDVVKDICSSYLDGTVFEVKDSKFDKVIRR